MNEPSADLRVVVTTEMVFGMTQKSAINSFLFPAAPVLFPYYVWAHEEKKLKIQNGFQK